MELKKIKPNRTKKSKPNGSRFKPKLICERLNQESTSPPPQNSSIKRQRLLTDEILEKKYKKESSKKKLKATAPYLPSGSAAFDHPGQK